MSQELGMKVYLDTDYETALEQVTKALKVEGFGVLTEIDVKATLKKKIDVDFRKYQILGACNPPLAHRALSAAPEVGSTALHPNTKFPKVLGECCPNSTSPAFFILPKYFHAS